MKRRDFIGTLGAAGISWRVPALAQTPGKIYRIALLGRAGASPYDAPLASGLAKHGYVLDRNLALEPRPAEEAAELTQGKVDLIISFGYKAALAAKDETTLPVVVFSAGDPVETRLAPSLAR